ncbi:hypothetical protein E4U40_007734, partial [Claviceps sp. LM458 group G5]
SAKRDRRSGSMSLVRYAAVSWVAEDAGAAEDPDAAAEDAGAAARAVERVTLPVAAAGV